MTHIIDNWESLSDTQKKQAEDMLKYVPLKETTKSNSSAKFFEKTGWLKIDNFINKDIANILYHYVILSTKRLNYLTENFNKSQIDEGVYGTFNDPMVLGNYSKYGDMIFDTLLDISLKKMEELLDINLTPTYTYHRLYTTNSDLKKHIDRPSCEISTTLCLGYDNSNIDFSMYPDYSWPLLIKEKDGNILPISLKQGDMLIYRGCEIEHWREPFKGKNHAQVFLHYNEKNGQYDINFDGRPTLGLPSTYKIESNVEKLILEKEQKIY